MRNGTRALTLAVVITGCVFTISVCGAYENAWVKYADDRATAYSIDSNSIMRNDAGNYYVQVMMDPYKNNVFNIKLNRTDVAYVYTEYEISITRNVIRALSVRVFNNKGHEVLSDTYAHTGELPPFENIIEGSVADTLKQYVVNRLKLPGQGRR